MFVRFSQLRIWLFHIVNGFCKCLNKSVVVYCVFCRVCFVRLSLYDCLYMAFSTFALCMVFDLFRNVFVCVFRTMYVFHFLFVSRNFVYSFRICLYVALSTVCLAFSCLHVVTHFLIWCSRFVCTMFARLCMVCACVVLVVL